jgi:hypothetical protein
MKPGDRWPLHAAWADMEEPCAIESRDVEMSSSSQSRMRFMEAQTSAERGTPADDDPTCNMARSISLRAGLRTRMINSGELGLEGVVRPGGAIRSDTGAQQPGHRGAGNTQRFSDYRKSNNVSGNNRSPRHRDPIRLCEIDRAV